MVTAVYIVTNIEWEFLFPHILNTFVVTCFLDDDNSHLDHKDSQNCFRLYFPRG